MSSSTNSIFANKTSLQIIHLTQDVPAHSINLIAYSITFVLSLVVFFGQKGHKLFASKQHAHRRHLWVVLLSVSLFSFYRMVSSATRAIHKAVRFSRSRETYLSPNGLGEVSVVLMVMGLPLFVLMFSNLITLWTSIVENSYIGSHKLVAMLRTTVVVITVAVFIDGGIASIGLCLTTVHPLLEPILVRYICGPVFGLLVLSLNIIIVIIGVLLIRGVREAFSDQKQTKVKQKQVQKMEYKLLIIYKVSIGCLLFLVAVNIQLLGVVLTAVLMSNEIFPALLLLGIPENVTMLMILFSFWPFSCRCCPSSVSTSKAAEANVERASKGFSSARPANKAQQFLRPIEMNQFDDDETSSDLVSVVESREEVTKETVAIPAAAPTELSQTAEETASTSS